MRVTRVLVFGGTGMLGSMIAQVLSEDGSFEVHATGRIPSLLDKARERLPAVTWHKLQIDTEEDNLSRLMRLPRAEWIINAIGMTKHFINATEPTHVIRSMRLNALFPYEIERWATSTASRVLQIATDCVFSGRDAPSNEHTPHDPLDVYGKTKSLGEATTSTTSLIRSSIIGPEPKGSSYLLEWFRSQPQGAALQGYTNHHWNGVTTYHFAKICAGIIKKNIVLPRLHHLVPADAVTKFELLHALQTNFKRDDITITPFATPISVDRRLATVQQSLNTALWEAAGFSLQPPSIAEMIEQSIAYSYSMGQNSNL